MSKAKSTGSPQLAARTHGVPSHRSQTSRSQPTTDPAPVAASNKITHAGYTGERVDRKTYVLRREDMGQASGKPTKGHMGAACVHHVTAPVTEESRHPWLPEGRNVRPRKPLPMHVQPHNWQARL